MISIKIGFNDTELPVAGGIAPEDNQEGTSAEKLKLSIDVILVWIVTGVADLNSRR